MGWRHDEKKARKLAASDPVAALELIEGAVPEARASKLSGHEHLCDLLAFRAEVAERAGEREVAAASTAELKAVAEKEMAGIDEQLAHSNGAMTVAGALQVKARYLERLGRQAEADRVRLHAADVLLAGVGDAGAKAGMTSSPFFVLTQGAMGFESASTFRKSYEKTYWAQAEALRNPLLESGKAVALAYCERCGGVVEADWKKRKCSHKHKVDDVRVVPAEEAEALRSELEQSAQANA